MLITIVALIILVIIGFLATLSKIKNISKQKDFTIEYHNKLLTVVNSVNEEAKNRVNAFDSKTYTWLQENAIKMQSELGSDGVHDMIDNLQGIKITNYQVIVNILPSISEFVREIHNSVTVNSISYERFITQVEYCTNLMVMHSGRLDLEYDSLTKKIFNPLYCFAKGIKFILEIPLYFLSSLGFLSDTSLSNITNSKIFNFFSGVSALIGLISSIMGIILGWNEFLEWIKHLF